MNRVRILYKGTSVNYSRVWGIFEDVSYSKDYVFPDSRNPLEILDAAIGNRALMRPHAVKAIFNRAGWEKFREAFDRKPLNQYSLKTYEADKDDPSGSITYNGVLCRKNWGDEEDGE